METIVHNFLDFEIVHDYDKILSVAPSENGLFVAPSEEYHPKGILKEKLNFSTLFFLSSSK